MVILRLADVFHIPPHRLPAFLDDGVVAKLLPDGPRHDDAGI